MMMLILIKWNIPTYHTLVLELDLPLNDIKVYTELPAISEVSELTARMDPTIVNEKLHIWS